MAAVSNDIGNLQIDPEIPSESSTDNDFASFAADQPGDTLLFYEIEAKILALWDQLNGLKLEIALQEAQNNPESGMKSKCAIVNETGAEICCSGLLEPFG